MAHSLAESAREQPHNGSSYLYDGEGHRVEQVATTSGTTTTTSYIGSLEEVSVTGATTTTTAYYGGLALSVNGALRYTLSDGLGSVSESVNVSDGSVTATQLYAPYGGVRYQSGTLPTDHGFTGQVSDAATSGLDYYGARYYDPAAGQFTSADTTLAGGLNRYAYVGGNPESRTDPSGHRYTCLGFVGCGGSGNNSGSGGCGAACGGGGAGGSFGSLPKGCNYGYKCQIDSVFKNPKTRQVLEFIANSGSKIGIKLLKFLLFVGAKLGGDRYITWTDKSLGKNVGAVTDYWTGDITLLNSLVPGPLPNEIGYRPDFSGAATALIHEAVESYFVIEKGNKFGATGSLRGDYVAQWFVGEFEKQASNASTQMYTVPDNGNNYGAYLLSFDQWLRTANGKSYSGEWYFSIDYWTTWGIVGSLAERDRSGFTAVGDYEISEVNQKQWDLAGYP